MKLSEFFSTEDAHVPVGTFIFSGDDKYQLVIGGDKWLRILNTKLHTLFPRSVRIKDTVPTKSEVIELIERVGLIGASFTYENPQPKFLKRGTILKSSDGSRYMLCGSIDYACLVNLTTGTVMSFGAKLRNMGKFEEDDLLRLNVLMCWEIISDELP